MHVLVQVLVVDKRLVLLHPRHNIVGSEDPTIARPCILDVQQHVNCTFATLWSLEEVEWVYVLHLSQQIAAENKRECGFYQSRMPWIDLSP